MEAGARERARDVGADRRVKAGDQGAAPNPSRISSAATRTESAPDKGVAGTDRIANNGTVLHLDRLDEGGAGRRRSFWEGSSYGRDRGWQRRAICA